MKKSPKSPAKPSRGGKSNEPQGTTAPKVKTRVRIGDVGVGNGPHQPYP